SLKRVTLAANAGWFGITALFPPGILRVGIARRERWTQRDFAFNHQPEYLRRAFVTVLDSVRARHSRAAHALRARGVPRNGTPDAVCGLNGGVNLVLSEGGHRFAVRTSAVVAVDLDPVGTLAGLIANHANQVRAIGFLCALGHEPFGRKSFRLVHACRDDGA